jgi:type I restriction enzyme R subunit
MSRAVSTEKSFESAVEHSLLDSGWRPIAAQAFDRPLGIFPTEAVEFLKASQQETWDRLVMKHGGEGRAVVKVTKRIADEITARGTVDVLRKGVKDSGETIHLAFFAPAHDITPGLRELYESNRLGVARQVHHSESNPADSLDLVLVVNGIPTASAELKNPLTNQTVQHAIKQYREDRNPADLIFRARVIVNFAVDPEQVYICTRLDGQKSRFLAFNQGSAGAGLPGGAGNPLNPAGYRTSYLWEQVWAPDAWMGLLENFVHDEEILDKNGKPTGKKRLLFPRYHQWHLVESLMAATVEAGPGVNRLAQHSAGSGKSNEISWTAHRLSRLHTPGDPVRLTDEVNAAGLGTNEPVFHKVIVITDRRVLDRQLQATVAGFEHTPGTVVRIDKNSQQLRDALAGNSARIIITTLQKFPVVAEHAAKVAGQRFAVIVDEAHSSTGGEAMKDLKNVLSGNVSPVEATLQAALEAHEAAEAAAEAEIDASSIESLVESSMAARGKQKNLSFFAFTATPKAKTLELFGERVTEPGGTDVFKPFHTYAMRQAIEEGYILDVLANYTTYETYRRISEADPADDKDVPVSKASKAIARFVSLHPTNLGQKAEIIVEHFRQKTAGKIGGHAKAMVVTRSRLHAVKYKQEIDRYIAKKGYGKGEHALHTLVAFSGTVIDPDTDATYTEAFMNGFPESQLPERFDTDEYQVLVVAEKYQTGFDQPLLHTMYVDKPLAGVKAVQTLSRLNRTHPGKTDTFVLDFANKSEDIVAAFEPFYEQSTALPTDPNILYTWQRDLLAAGVIDPTEMTKAVEAILAGGPGKQQTVYANLNPAADRFTALDDEQQDTFRDSLAGYIRAYAFLAQVMSWTDPDLETLYIYARALQPTLPPKDTTTLPPISEAVLLTHLRTEKAFEGSLSLNADTTPQKAIANDGKGKANDEPVEPLSVLIQSLNDRFGLNLSDADKIWVEQQRQTVKSDDEARVVALTNDPDQYREWLAKRVEDAIVDRHMANGVLFNMFMDKPEFQKMITDYIASTYDEFRAEGGTA